MPRKRYIKCTRLFSVTKDRVKAVVKQVRETRENFYFPLHTRHHWLAGILMLDNDPTQLRLRVFDSAPSHVVRKEVKLAYKNIDPTIQISFVKCTRQERNSNDCGIYMLAHIFSDAMKERIVDPTTAPARVRPFLYKALKMKPGKKVFLENLRKLLGERTAQKTTTTSCVMKGGASDSDEDDILLRDLVAERRCDATRRAEQDERTQEILDEAEQHREALVRRNMTGFMASVALHRRCLGVKIALSVDALSMRKLRMHIETDDPNQILEMLPTAVHPYRGEVAEEDAAARPQDDPYILRKTEDGALPRTLRGVRFVLGITTRIQETTPATQRGNSRPRSSPSTPRDVEPRTNTYFALTEIAAEAQWGLYMPTAETPPSAEEVPDRARLLNEEAPGLNGRGSRPRGYVCPRHWRVYAGKPAKTSQAAWEKLSPHTRRQHRIAIEDLANMPHDLLALDLAAAAIRIIHRMAKLRKWKASTIVSKFATMHGALMHLPLYTDQPHPINLKESPEWTSAYGRWHQLMNSDIPNPPPFILKHQVDAAAYQLLSDPEARLFLMMMWSFAARPGDIGGLKPTDVHMQTPTRESYPVGLTYRKGKATHFRGPYPVASHLSRQDGAQLAHLLSQRPANSPLFKDPPAMKKKVRAALKSVVPELELASLRKGAVHRLARAKVAEEDIMRLTGHTSVITLRRYLNYSEQPTREAAMAQDSASALLRDPTP
ncbi:TATE DNA Transposon [Leptomonas pyrrhocoris]|uniref:TATE DNA Transposon n=1 Tax=Leptomonas pyrrhocoris TaxID=157538 RepID=A0A0M9FZX3_LEPPY|nr:TATE DNA Transposon [Leptomonas pyrrhocoris]XP_015659645.1 TATE DNA Transposon [Leptomonas pyrrhocoris]KPA79560.1 TATE DNA Transposon [Leptomonas pyrrhocoris]KPA81206.1 TATE DNA Transposon [Leptomonas pyrrhocoris]|eukprot:XP_015657999.1 TATE DNA Transposon [Leptomonas pyrrhocoris]